MSSDIAYMPATQLVRELRSGTISSREATTAYLERIDQVNPKVNAVVTLVADQALKAADALDSRRAAGDDLGPLHGLPMVHKDTHNTAGVRTTFGSPLMKDNVPQQDDLIISRLKSAGVVSMGKTNTPEYAAGSHTFNTVFGLTRNPYDLSKSAGGSSGGAAVALACGMTPIADGSDMGGSLRNPASFCNVVGLRPTIGRVPSYPNPLAGFELSTSGPMARSIDDLALMLAASSGTDARVPNALTTSAADITPYEVDASTLRIAIAPDFSGRLPIDYEVIAAVEAAGAVFEGLGAALEPAMVDLSGAEDAFLTRRAWQFAAGFGPLIDEHPGVLKESIVWNVEEGRKLTGADLARAAALCVALYERMVEFFNTYDALLLPTAQVLPFDADQEYPTQINGTELGSYLEWMRSCCDITATGAPGLSVPAGFSSAGLPIGLQIVTAPRAEAKLLSIGKLYEQATRFAQTRPSVL
ncbi:MAG: amidase [Antricoccus sp.]